MSTIVFLSLCNSAKSTDVHQLQYTVGGNHISTIKRHTQHAAVYNILLCVACALENFKVHGHTAIWEK